MILQKAASPIVSDKSAAVYMMANKIRINHGMLTFEPPKSLVEWKL